MKTVNWTVGIALMVTVAAVILKSQLGNIFSYLDYNKAKKANTVMAYRQFLEKHPSDQRKSLIAPQLDRLAWEGASGSNSLKMIEAYLREFPDGKYVPAGIEMNRAISRITSQHVGLWAPNCRSRLKHSVDSSAFWGGGRPTSSPHRWLWNGRSNRKAFSVPRGLVSCRWFASSPAG